MRIRSVTLFLAAALPLAACSYESLEGDYDGEIDCDGGSVGMSLDLSENGTGFYDATGETDPITLDGTPTIFLFELSIEQSAPKGSQTVDVDEAACTSLVESGATAEIDCSDFDELGFDGENTLSAEVSNFLSTGLDCEMVLER
jgi:hypothetical protein